MGPTYNAHFKFKNAKEYINVYRKNKKKTSEWDEHISESRPKILTHLTLKFRQNKYIQRKNSVLPSIQMTQSFKNEKYQFFKCENIKKN